jgi:SH3 domain protein
MKKFNFRIILGFLFVLTIITVASAQTRYVSDSLIITVRERPDNSSTHIKNITTDTAMETLEESGDYLKVQLGDGTEGYVKTRYTTTDTPKPTIISNLKRANSRLQKQYEELTSSLNEQESDSVARLKQLQTDLQKLQKERSEQSATISRLNSELDTLNKEYTSLKESADNVVQIISQSDTLRADNERLQIEFEAMQNENAMLLRTAVIKWVLTGAGILFIGWIMGKVSRKKRR